MLCNNGGTRELDRVLRWYLVKPEMWMPLGSWVVMPRMKRRGKGMMEVWEQRTLTSGASEIQGAVGV